MTTEKKKKKKLGSNEYQISYGDFFVWANYILKYPWLSESYASI